MNRKKENLIRMKVNIALLMVALVGICSAGWERTLGGSGNDYGGAVLKTTDGGYVIGGSKETSAYSGIYDAYLIKTNSSGIPVWSGTYGTSDYDYGCSIATSLDGGYVIAGYTWASTRGYDFYLVKTNSSGSMLWSRTYGSSNHDFARSIARTSDGGYIMAGYTFETDPYLNDIYVVKTNSSGDEIWNKTFSGSFNYVALSIIQTTDGGYIIAGYTDSLGAGEDDVYIIKTNSSGNIAWTRIIDLGSRDVASSILQTTAGDYLITGSSESVGLGESDLFILKLNSSGSTQWIKTYGGSDDDNGASISRTSDNGFIIVGSTQSYGAGEYDVYLLKTNSSGDTLWTQTYGRISNDYGTSVSQTSDGGYIIGGTTESFGSGGSDIYLIKVDAVGIVEWVNQKPRNLFISAYPNPFNSACRISAPENAVVEIFDINGRSIAEFDGGDRIWKPEASVGGGVYLVRAKIGDKDITKRVVYLK